MEKIKTSVYVGQLINNNDFQTENYMAYVLRTDGEVIVGQDVYNYLHTQQDEYNNQQLEEKFYSVATLVNEEQYNDSLPYSSSIDLVDGYTIRLMMKIANPNEKTEEDITDMLAFMALPMAEQFELLHGYAYSKVKNNKNI